MKKFFKILGTIILGLILFLGVTSLLILIPLRHTINENTIRNMVSSLEIEKEVENNPELKESIEEALMPIYDITREVGLSDDVVLKLLDTQEVKDLIGDIGSNVYNAIITGEKQKLINVQNIERIISEAIDDINALDIYEIDNKTKNEIIDFVKEEVNDYEDLLPETDVVLDGLSEEDVKTLNIVRFVLSDELVLIVSVISLGALLLIILLNLAKWHWIKVSSGIVLGSTILMILVTSVILGVNNYYLASDYSYISDFISGYVNLNYLISGITFLVAIIILITYSIVLKKITKREEA